MAVWFYHAANSFLRYYCNSKAEMAGVSPFYFGLDMRTVHGERICSLVYLAVDRMQKRNPSLATAK